MRSNPIADARRHDAMLSRLERKHDPKFQFRRDAAKERDEVRQLFQARKIDLEHAEGLLKAIDDRIKPQELQVRRQLAAEDMHAKHGGWMGAIAVFCMIFIPIAIVYWIAH